MVYGMDEILLGVLSSQRKKSEFMSDHRSLARFFYYQKQDKNYQLLEHLRFKGHEFAPYCHEVAEATFILLNSNYIGLIGLNLDSYKLSYEATKKRFKEKIKPNLSLKERREIRQLGRDFWKELGIK